MAQFLIVHGFGRCRRGYLFLLGATALAVALADWLFYGHTIGWTAGLFAAAVIALLAARDGGFLRTWPGRAVTLAAGGLLAALVEEPAPLAVNMTCLAVGMLAVLNRNDWPGGARDWTARLVGALGVSLSRLVTDNRIAARWMRRHPFSLRSPMRTATVWLLPVALGFVFVLLFRAANPIIAELVGVAFDWIADKLSRLIDLIELPRNFFWLAVAAVVYALLRVRRIRRRVVPPPLPAWATTVDEAEAATAARRAAFATAVVVRCLLLFNVLFAVQNLLDVAFLFGGAELPEGMTHSEYVHRGAYPLIATALLAAVFVLVAFRPGGPAERSVLARRLVYAWVAQNVFLTLTAAWRLDLYVEAYSLTRMRVAAGIWMLLVATGLVWIGCRIVFRRDNAWLLNVNVLTTVAVLYACCFVNFDRVIADYNIDHCLETGGGGAPIDIDYLRTLGPDALPALRRITPVLDTSARRRASLAYVEALERELTDDLSDWRGWTLRRSRLNDGVAPNPMPQLAGYDPVHAAPTPVQRNDPVATSRSYRSRR